MPAVTIARSCAQDVSLRMHTSYVSEDYGQKDTMLVGPSNTNIGWVGGSGEYPYSTTTFSGLLPYVQFAGEGSPTGVNQVTYNWQDGWIAELYWTQLMITSEYNVKPSRRINAHCLCWEGGGYRALRPPFTVISPWNYPIPANKRMGAAPPRSYRHSIQPKPTPIYCPHTQPTSRRRSSCQRLQLHWDHLVRRQRPACCGCSIRRAWCCQWLRGKSSGSHQPKLRHAHPRFQWILCLHAQ